MSSGNRRDQISDASDAYSLKLLSSLIKQLLGKLMCIESTVEAAEKEFYEWKNDVSVSQIELDLAELRQRTIPNF